MVRYSRKIDAPQSRTSTAITEEQLKTIFMQHDVDGDGRLSLEELTKAFKYMGSYYPGWRARRCLSNVDKNQDGFVDLDEIERVVQYAKRFSFTVR